MASPMNWFRTHQKGLLIVFGVLLMVSFGMAGVMSTWTDAQNRSREEVKDVVEFDGGKLTDLDLALMRMRHFQTIRFLDALIQAQARQRPDYKRPANIMIVPLQENTSLEMANEELLTRLLALRKAEEFGLRVSDDAVIQYLRNMADDQSLSNTDFTRICQELTEGSVKFAQVREQLKSELAYAQVMDMFEAGVPMAPTAATEAWDAFLKLEQKIECEVLALPVANYLDQVSGKPSESEMRDLYEKGKYHFDSMAGERPGFKQPNKLAVSHLKAPFSEFLERAKLRVTPEQIKAEYDVLVARQDPMVLEVIPSEDTPPDVNLDGDAPPEPPTEDDGNPAKSDPPAGETGEQPADSTPDPSNPSGDEAPPVEEKKDDAGDGDPGLQSSAYQTIALTAHQAESPLVQEEKKDSPPEAKPQEEEKEKEEDEDEAKPSDPAAPSDQQTIPPPPTVPGFNQDDLSIPGQQMETRVRELDEKLSDQIRARLATPVAIEDVRRAIEEALFEISDYGASLESYEQTKDLPASERTGMPEPISLSAIADKYHLSLEEFPLSSFLEFSKSPAGNIQIGVESQFGTQAYPAANVLFGQFEERAVWQPVEFPSAISEDYHLFVVTEKAETRVPDFEEARPLIETWWKREEATKLAEEEGKKLAEELNGSGKTLLQHDPANAKNTGLFSWMTQFGSYPTLPGGIQPGEEFMSTAFRLPLGKAGVAPDQTRENYCVIQPVKEGTVPLEELEKQFFETIAANQGFGFGIGRVYMNTGLAEFMREFNKQLNEEYEVKWMAH